ncbi:MAG: hypothetical protein H8D92_02220 [Pelagibacteraceae bacterium]|jgi:hypothetical protein|nr:hypothetical protein [Pelagibacteraceae bacterium]|tara:strand:+ start:65 stop:490 length:426 start_codon:yes stop_codon:yes gene_type:complete
MNNGYYAVMLDKQSCNAIKSSARMSVVKADHITLAYKPNDKTFKQLNKFIGKKIGAMINGLRANKNIEAFWVKDMFLTETDKRIKRVDPGSTHITLSYKDGFKSGDANTMFTDPTYKKERLGYVEGTFKWISFNKKKEKDE